MGLKLKDIRVGNYLLQGRNIVIIIKKTSDGFLQYMIPPILEKDSYTYTRPSIEDDNVYQKKIRSFKGVPLDYDWFVKLGFKGRGNGYFSIDSVFISGIKRITHYFEKNNETPNEYMYRDKFSPLDCKYHSFRFHYVHEVQNFYHKETSQELTVNEDIRIVKSLLTVLKMVLDDENDPMNFTNLSVPTRAYIEKALRWCPVKLRIDLEEIKKYYNYEILTINTKLSDPKTSKFSRRELLLKRGYYEGFVKQITVN